MRLFSAPSYTPGVLLYGCLLAFVFGAGCGRQENATQGKAKADGPALFADYRVWASEGDSMATCMLQFFTNQQKRQSLLLQDPASVSVDQVPLQGDSARITGAYYEYQQPLTAFAGSHAIVFENGNGKTFRDSFFFPVFTIASELPEVIAVGDREIRLSGIPDGAELRVVLTDTSFAGKEYNELHTVRGGAVQLKKADLAQLHTGPVVLHLSAEEERPLNGALRGALSVTYSLTRSFLLRQAAGSR